VKKVVALAAGGTGGHVFPAIAVADALRDLGLTPILLTDARGKTYTREVGDMEVMALPAAQLRKSVGGMAKASLTIGRAFVSARRILRRSDARCLVGFGGYPSFAPALAARSLGLPLILHEQATRLSLANRMLLRFASTLATSFESVAGAEKIAAEKIVQTGNPVRSAFRSMARHPYPRLGPDDAIKLLVIAGSQGSQAFDEAVPEAILSLPSDLLRRLRLTIQYRGEDAEEVARRLAAQGVAANVRAFHGNMPDEIGSASLILCRAGASFAAEVLTVGRPAIYVPIPGGGSAVEQASNAQTLERLGAGWFLAQSDMRARLPQLLRELLLAPERLATAAAIAATLGDADAAAKLAALIQATIHSAP
jgi:UDP-N-acetylglucosamine--N-acetylmuramyl-(pentapeptide) pyrophosphoryl-undecaprenol N-acetylglucosamine transferase